MRDLVLREDGVEMSFKAERTYKERLYAPL